MVGRVLRNHEIVFRDNATKSYQLADYDDLTPGAVKRPYRNCRVSDRQPRKVDIGVAKVMGWPGAAHL